MKTTKFKKADMFIYEIVAGMRETYNTRIHLITEDDPSFCERPREGDTMLVRRSNVCQAVQQVHGVAWHVLCSLRRVCFHVPFVILSGYAQDALRKRRVYGRKRTDMYIFFI
jgi:hypothetical protein